MTDMTKEDYTTLLHDLDVLRRIRKSYPFKTIENIIQSMEAVVKEVNKQVKDNG